MFIVGVVGENDKAYQTVDLLLRLYLSKDYAAMAKDIEYNDLGNFVNIVSEAQLNKCEILILFINQECLEDDLISNINVDILICLNRFQAFGEDNKNLMRILNRKNIIILNSDDKSIFPFLIGTGTTLITCGINSKASVTASSIVGEDSAEKIQCCIQRTIKTLSGEELEPQEFTVNIGKDEKNDSEVTSVLAAVTAAIAADVEIGNIDTFLI